MAGQLGFDPPTMTLCGGGPIGELEQALVNSEAIAKSFNCSIMTSAILFVIYCSKSTSKLDRISLQEKQNSFLNQTKRLLNPVFLYVLVPDLPKRYSNLQKNPFYFHRYTDFSHLTMLL